VPRISVIIPCFNQGQYIDEAVDSVLSQTFNDFEIIIIDDGSNEVFTIEKLKNYSKLKARVIRTENRGLSAARNIGFIEAKGDLLQFLDADDTIDSLKFEEQLNIFEKYPETDICFTDYRIYDINKNSFLNNPTAAFPGGIPLEDFLFRWERGWNIPIHSAIFKKKNWNTSTPFNEKLRAKEDWLMWCDLAVRNKNFKFLDKKYAVYRYHNTNMTKNSAEMYYAFLLAAIYIMQIIPEKYIEEFLMETILHINKSIEKAIYFDLTNQIADLKSRFSDMDKTIDYKIGNLLLRPYRYFKTIFIGKKYF
jgi:O-antigen biosynthesis protein